MKERERENVFNIVAAGANTALIINFHKLLEKNVENYETRSAAVFVGCDVTQCEATALMLDVVFSRNPLELNLKTNKRTTVCGSRQFQFHHHIITRSLISRKLAPTDQTYGTEHEEQGLSSEI